MQKSGRGRFSRLEDEIYKTVTSLYQTKDAAVRARNAFAENLSNVAHQIKTPITAISLSVQMLQKGYEEERFLQIQKQLVRLTRLEEALVLAGRPILISLPAAILAIWAMLRASYLPMGDFLARAPFIPVIVFGMAVLGAVAFAYYLGWRQVKRIDLPEVLRDDSML